MITQTSKYIEYFLKNIFLFNNIDFYKSYINVYKIVVYTSLF